MKYYKDYNMKMKEEGLYEKMVYINESKGYKIKKEMINDKRK
jgi:hypothetical protein